MKRLATTPMTVLSCAMLWFAAGGCNLGYDPDDVVLRTAEDGISDPAEEPDAIQPGDPSDPALDVAVDPEMPDESSTDLTDPSDPVDTAELTDPIDSSDPVDVAADAADLADADEEPEPGPCAVRICTGTPTLLVYDESFDSYNPGETPCAWAGSAPLGGPAGPPPVVAATDTPRQKVLQAAPSAAGGRFSFEAQTQPFMLELDFRASTVGTTGTLDTLCLLAPETPSCLTVLNFVSRDNQMFAQYLAFYEELVVEPLGTIEPGSWHHITMLVQPHNADGGGVYDLWFDGAFGGSAIPILEPTGPDEAPFGRLHFAADPRGTRPPLAVDDVFVAPLLCDDWTGQSTCERQRPMARMFPGALNGMWAGSTEGDTTGAEDLYTGSCQTGDTGGPDEVVPVYIPRTLLTLNVSTASSSFDTTLYLRQVCDDPLSEVSSGCNEDSDPQGGVYTAYLTLSCIGAGTYYAIVDGDDAEEFGAYQVRFAGMQDLNGYCN